MKSDEAHEIGYFEMTTPVRIFLEIMAFEIATQGNRNSNHYSVVRTAQQSATCGVNLLVGETYILSGTHNASLNITHNASLITHTVPLYCAEP